MSIPDTIKPTVMRRQRQRTQYATALRALLGVDELAGLAGPIIVTAQGLLEENRHDLSASGDPRLNGSLSTALDLEANAWKTLKRRWALLHPDGTTQRLLSDDLDTITRVLAVQDTLVELGVPTERAPLDAGDATSKDVDLLTRLSDRYTQLYGKRSQKMD